MKERRPYEKPQVTRIPIRPQESLIDNCKTVAQGLCELSFEFGS